eukprot:7288-Heterococcus_DN1.PRE.3
MQVAPDTCYLIINHISKSNNIKTLITSAKAFGAKVLIVGAPKACTAHSHALSLLAEGDGKRFDTLQACRDWLNSMNVAIVGVEIVAAADTIESEPFDGSVAFLMGNEGSGMSEQQKAICDRFVIISQYGGGTASLNVAVAASIVLQRFWCWKDRQRCLSA